MSTIKELRDYIHENPALIGHESEFIYAVYTIDGSIGIHADLGIMGEPFSGKRQFCLTLKKWFEREGWRCSILKIDDDSTFNGDVVFLLDNDPVCYDKKWIEKRKKRVEFFTSQNIFVVYTSVIEVFGSGETLALRELKQDDFLRLIREISGYGNEIVTFSNQMNIPLPKSPLIAKSICNHLLGLNVVTSDSIGEIMEMQSRQRRAGSIIPRIERDLWRSRFNSMNLRTWKATRCGVRFFIEDDGLAKLGISSKEGPGFLFSETMCTLSYCIWDEPNGSDYSDAIELNIAAMRSGFDLPQVFYDDAIRLSTSVLKPEMVMDIGLDLVLTYIMELVRYRVYDRNRPLSCMVLLQNAKALKDIRDIFEKLESDLINNKCWDQQLKNALDEVVYKNPSYGDFDTTSRSMIKGFIAREIKATISSEILKTLNDPITNNIAEQRINDVFNQVCVAIQSFKDDISADDGLCSWCDMSDFEKKYSKLLHAIRTEIDFNLLKVENRFREDIRCGTKTVMGFQKTMFTNYPIELNSRQSLWVHLLWDEFEVNARWVNLKTVYGYAESSKLIRCIEYIHRVNTTYPLSRFKPVNEEIDFSSITMYSELLDPEIFNLFEQFKEPSWYKINYGLTESDRSVIYLEKSKCRVRWEKGEAWDKVYEDWEKIYGIANEARDRNDSLMRINLLKDLFHYFRLYCERDKKEMCSYMEKMEKKHRGIDSEPLKVGYALITLELSRAELLCEHTVKSMEYLDIVRSMVANNDVDINSVLYRVAIMDTEARLEFNLGKTRSAIRKMEDMRSECMTNGLVSQYVVAGKHLYEMYYNSKNENTNNTGNLGNTGKSNRRIKKDRLCIELGRYADKLKEQKEGRRYQLILDIINTVICCDSAEPKSNGKESRVLGKGMGAKKTD